LKFDVIGFGALNVDKLYRVDSIALGGEERRVKGYVESPGGSAANTITGLARLEHRTGYVGKIGNDYEGVFLLKNFAVEKVDTGGIVISESGRSGVVVGFVDDKGERALYIDSGANDTLSLEEVDKDYVSEARFLHLTSFVGETPFKAQKELLPALSDVQVSFDPGALYAQRGLDALRPILRRSFIVFPSENELKLLTGKRYESGAKALIDEGPQIVAVKLGEKGCYVTDGKEKFLVEPFKVKVVDTTGAGDAFCAGFLHGLLSGRDLYTCGRIANYTASRKIEKAGAREGLPRLSDLPKI